MRYGSVPCLLLPVKLMQRFGIGKILSVTKVLNRTYAPRLTAHSHGYRVLNQVSPVGGLRGALYESLHQFTALG